MESLLAVNAGLAALEESEQAHLICLMPEQVAEVFLNAAVKRMQQSGKDIDRCLEKLSDEQILHRGADHENSIANLLLHLEGNLQQWFLHGVGGEPDVRKRDAEFALSLTEDCAAIRSAFHRTLARSQEVIGSLAPERLLETIEPQPGNPAMTILEAILRITGHLQMHQGQIVLLTKQLVAADLDFTIPRKR